MRDETDHNSLRYKMFYTGDLQSGISEAVQASKMVACFVTGTISLSFVSESVMAAADRCSDDGEESQMWENELLQEANVCQQPSTGP